MPVSLERLNRDSIRKGSKSFSLASLAFDRRAREGSHALYHFCRYCDDVIDTAKTQIEARAALALLKEQIDQLERGDEPSEPAFQAFNEVRRQNSIPLRYVRDLLAGFECDVEHQPVTSETELDLYAYRVAGVVGLMMCHIMGLSRADARAQAVDLGLAMQMTNIARDVKEDFENGRVYLPVIWLSEAGLDRESFLAHEAETFELVERLLRHADAHYRAGLKGLGALPLRAAVAVSIAASVYSAIGDKILRKGSVALRSRTYLTGIEKAICVFRGLVRVAPLSIARLLRPWRETQLIGDWKYK